MRPSSPRCRPLPGARSYPTVNHQSLVNASAVKTVLATSSSATKRNTFRSSQEDDLDGIWKEYIRCLDQH